MEASKLKIGKYTIMFLLLTLTIFGTQVYATEPTEPHNANAMWIEPSSMNVGGNPIGYRFNVTFWANSSLETKGWQFWLTYENAYINATRAGYTAGDKSEFYQNITTLPVTPLFTVNWNATHNRLDFGEAWIMGSKRGPGYGSLCWVEFEVVALPPEDQVVEIPLSIKWAYEVYDPPKTYLIYSDGSLRPLDVYDGLVIIPEFTPLLMLISLFALTTPILLRNYKKKQ
jgi:hypothetical protein